jgi:cobalt-zinc-cadmium efflux system membrane fusion protein
VDEPGHAPEASEEGTPRGPLGGRLFTADGVQLELRIVEDDMPPTFVAHLRDSVGAAIDPTRAELSVELERFGARKERLEFDPVTNHLRSRDEVREPHSFVASITLELDGQTHTWQYEQVEFRVELTPEAVAAAGIVSEAVGPSRIRVIAKAPGEVRLDADRVQYVRPRFAGILSRMLHRLGDRVAAGDTLAIVQSNESLRDYAVVAAMTGTVVARSGTVGAAVHSEDTIYTLADLSSVWVDIAIHPHDVGLVKPGQPVQFWATTRAELRAEATIDYVGPLLEQDTRVSYARVRLPNKGGHWQPGLYVISEVTIDDADVDVAVPETAIIRSRFGPAVFRSAGSTFEIQPIRTGRSDGVTTEVLSGLAVGDLVVTQNAFLLKAELGKSEAKHDH